MKIQLSPLQWKAQSWSERAPLNQLWRLFLIFPRVVIFRGPNTPDRFGKSSRSTHLKRDLCLVVCACSVIWAEPGWCASKDLCQNFCFYFKAKLKKRWAQGCFSDQIKAGSGFSNSTNPQAWDADYSIQRGPHATSSTGGHRLYLCRTWVADRRKTQTWPNSAGSTRPDCWNVSAWLIRADRRESGAHLNFHKGDPKAQPVKRMRSAAWERFNRSDQHFLRPVLSPFF